MNRFLKRNEDSELERELRRNRPQLRAEFLQMLSDRVESQSRLRRSLRPRIAAVAVASAAMLAAVAAFGGVGYAATGIHDVVVSAAKVVGVAAKGDHKKSGDSKSQGDKKSGGDNKGAKGDNGGKPDDKEYGHKKKVCHNPGTHQQTIEVADNAVAVHLAHGDYLGECKKNGRS